MSPRIVVSVLLACMLAAAVASPHGALGAKLSARMNQLQDAFPPGPQQ